MACVRRSPGVRRSWSHALRAAHARVGAVRRPAGWVLRVAAPARPDADGAQLRALAKRARRRPPSRRSVLADRGVGQSLATELRVLRRRRDRRGRRPTRAGRCRSSKQLTHLSRCVARSLGARAVIELSFARYRLAGDASVTVCTSACQESVIDGGRKSVGTFDMLIRGGTVIDGTGAPRSSRRCRDRQRSRRRRCPRTSSVPPTASSTRPIESSPRASSTSTPTSTPSSRGIPSDPAAAYHGITSVVMGNCGVTFAPCKPEDREHLGGDDGERRRHSARRNPRRSAVGLGHLRRVPRQRRPPAEGPQRRWHGRALRAAPIRDGRARNRAGSADRRRSGDDDRAARRGTPQRSARLQHQPNVPAQSARRAAGAGHVRRTGRAVRVRRRARAVMVPASSRAPAASARATATTPTSR